MYKLKQYIILKYNALGGVISGTQECAYSHNKLYYFFSLPIIDYTHDFMTILLILLILIIDLYL